MGRQSVKWKSLQNDQTNTLEPEDKTAETEILRPCSEISAELPCEDSAGPGQEAHPETSGETSHQLDRFDRQRSERNGNIRIRTSVSTGQKTLEQTHPALCSELERSSVTTTTWEFFLSHSSFVIRDLLSFVQGESNPRGGCAEAFRGWRLAHGLPSHLWTQVSFGK